MLFPCVGSNKIFSDSVFNSYENLIDFFKNSGDLEKIAKSAENDSAVKPLSYNRWHLLSMDVRRSIFKRSKAWLERLAPRLERSSPNLVKRCYVSIEAGKQKNATPFYLREIKGQILVRSINYYQPRIHDFYLHARLEFRLRYLLNSSMQWMTDSALEFYHPNGLCTGICFWFIYLYFKTIDLFPNSIEHHLVEISKLFKSGATYHAALLQGLNKVNAPWLRRHILQIEIEGLSKTKNYHSTRIISTEKLYQGPTANQELLEMLPDGPHFLEFFELHQTLSFKVGQEFFIFDPNVGLIKFFGENKIQSVHDFFIKYAETHDPNRSSYVAFKGVKPIEKDSEKDEEFVLKVDWRRS